MYLFTYVCEMFIGIEALRFAKLKHNSITKCNFKRMTLLWCSTNNGLCIYF